MDPVVVAAMISAGTKIGLSLFDRWTATSDDAKAAALLSKTRAFVSDHYDTLRDLTSDNCMRLLKTMESGANNSQEGLALGFFGTGSELFTAEPGVVRLIHSEFEYRLLFMLLAGLLRKNARGEFAITPIGRTFVAKAREKKDYPNVL